MDRRAKLLKHLSRAELYIAEGIRQIDQQQRFIEQLDRDGHDSSDAVQLLGYMADMQRAHMDDLRRMREELALEDA